jgi:hypothetical protein
MKLNTLKPGKGFEKRVHWCGPAALALITGRTLKHCHNLLAKVSHKEPRYLKGVSNTAMHRALRSMGYKVTGIAIPLREGKKTMHMPTLRQWIDEDMKTRVWRGVVLVNVTRHYVVAHRGLVADNVEPEPRPAYSHRKGRALIEQAWLIEKA